ncbi:phosphonate ABC transporter, permease protein PhnE [Kaistia dalseonensis]|uniref:Phosphonate transport system permease protein n=1 Tax=Kaistia dalseonensis TaxID=410840 RepID=A0ABU0H8F2_9HYPH|nr:phosphonate ABC transporter, permease protein PhnE [Kaistia dalseonensis]MCX5495987.1 phosphonate ABC transporter, permease protein PhnE [Kaistia dalseonensis]MDQ0438590.1 phosphonate transport system permease protein [Kaistia dalseonensis]
MATAIPVLPAGQAKALDDAYQAAVSARRLRTLMVLGIIVVLILISANLAHVRPLTLFGNIGNFGSFIGKTIPVLTFGNFFADMREWYWNFPKWLGLLGQTILIAYLGTFMGAIVAFCLCFLASANLAQSRWTRIVARRFLEFCRTVPDIVFALIFVIAFGLGPMAGVFALSIHTVGALGKLFAEVVENIDMKPVEGMSAAGANWFQTIRFAVLPQVLPGFASYSLLRFEINVRGAGVMGFVGAGGIGQEFLVAIRNFYYTDVSAILLMIIATVILIDLGTEQVRHRLIGIGEHR